MGGGGEPSLEERGVEAIGMLVAKTSKAKLEVDGDGGVERVAAAVMVVMVGWLAGWA